MIAEKIENLLKQASAAQVSEIVCVVILAAFIWGLLCLWRGGAGNRFVAYTPALLTSLGIFGTFSGIVIGLLGFNTTDIDGSIEGLLSGLKTAFVTSLFGIFSSILFKILQASGVIRKRVENSLPETATVEDMLAAVHRQNETLTKLVSVVGEESDGSLLGQIKLLRSDSNDSLKQLQKDQKQAGDTLKEIQDILNSQGDGFQQFSDKLWLKLQDFADMMASSATDAVIEALKQVISDFNSNLTEQFGDNFQQLNEAVKELIVWQENYKIQLSEMMDQYKQGVLSISATEAAVLAISSESRAIPQTMNDLKAIIEVNQNQLTQLEDHLGAFKDIRDRAVEAVPEIRRQIDQTVKEVSDSVASASTHYQTLLTESDKYIQSHVQASSELLDQFVSNTKVGVDTIGIKIAESASSFVDKVQRTNEGLQETANHVTLQSDVIKDTLKDTADDLNRHVREMIHSIIENSKTITKTFVDASRDLSKDTTSVRDSVVNSIEEMQKKLESSLDSVFAAQTQQMHKTFSSIEHELQNQVGKTGVAVEKQLAMIDQSMQQEINRVMNEMGKALAQISNQFVNDYGELVNRMDRITRVQ